MPCTYYSVILVRISTCWSVQLKSYCKKLLSYLSFSDSIHTFLLQKIIKLKSDTKSPAINVRQVKCGLLSGWQIHLPHWLLMVREKEWWRKNRGCGSMWGAQQACCSQGWRAWERQPTNRASSVFRRTDSEWTRLCPLHFQSQEFQGEKCLLVSLQPEITPKPAASPLKVRWWVEITQSVLTLSHGRQCSTAFLWT